MTMKISYMETKRIKLQEITEKDAELIVQWRSNPDVYKYFILNHAITYDEHIKWFYTQYLYDMNRFDYIARTKKDNTALGVFGIKRQEKLKKCAEISYILDSPYRGKGYASEAVSRLIDFAKMEWCCHMMVAKIHKNNINSICFIKKLGFNPILQDRNFVIYKKLL